MINIIRNIVTALLFSPLIVLIHLTTLFVGKRKAVLYWGPLITSLAKRSLRFWVPAIGSAKDFDTFPSKMKANFWIWRPFFDISVAEETNDAFKINVHNCPICVVFNMTGLSDLNPYLCKGDWVKADENKDKWLFEREHQIGTGDTFCDHTYKRKR
jgi:hypothetical protein